MPSSLNSEGRLTSSPLVIPAQAGIHFELKRHWIPPRRSTGRAEKRQARNDEAVLVSY